MWAPTPTIRKPPKVVLGSENHPAGRFQGHRRTDLSTRFLAKYSCPFRCISRRYCIGIITVLHEYRTDISREVYRVHLCRFHLRRAEHRSCVDGCRERLKVAWKRPSVEALRARVLARTATLSVLFKVSWRLLTETRNQCSSLCVLFSWCF